jgi:hypothetical protein
LGKKKGHKNKNHPKKKDGHFLLRWPADVKKQNGFEQEEAFYVRWANA